MPNLMHNWFRFNNANSDSFGLHIERVPNQNRPERKYDRYSVPGRNGDIFVYQDAWENIDQSYEVWGGDGALGSATALGYTLSNWLFYRQGSGIHGYEKLSDSYDPGHFRYAVFTGPFDFESQLTRRGRATLTFNCDPRRFIAHSDEWEYEFDYGQQPFELANPTIYTAKPSFLLDWVGTGSVTIECGGKTLNISNVVDGMIIDCESMTAYGTTSDHPNLNYLLSGEFPVIEPGEQTIAVTGPVNRLLVAPFWWEL